MTETATDPLAPVSHEVEGRILTGVGVSADDLAETMERHSTDIEPTDANPASTPTPPSQDETKPRQSRGQRRFDELTREREEARREADTAKREAAELRARLSAPPEPTRTPAAPAPATATPKAPETRSKPTEDEIGSKYQSYGDYVEDLADWKAEQRLAAMDFDARIRQSIEADRASRTFADTVEQTLAKGRELFPDFDAVRTAGPGSAVNFEPAKMQALFALPPETRVRVMYAIAKDAAVAQRLASLPDTMFGYELAALAPSQVVASPASTPAGGSPVVPAPYQPVGSGSKTASVPSSELPKKAGFDFDKSGYREKRAAERGMRR